MSSTIFYCCSYCKILQKDISIKDNNIFVKIV